MDLKNLIKFSHTFLFSLLIFHTAAYSYTAPGPGYRVIYVQDTGNFWVDKKNDWIKSKIQHGSKWEPFHIQLMKLLTCKGERIVDVGAHIGLHVVAMANHVGSNGHIYCFEPSEKIYKELTHNIKLNSLENVSAFPFAIGNYDGFCLMNPLPIHDEGHREIHWEGERLLSGRVSAQIYDQVLIHQIDTLGIDTEGIIALVKIDVEGFESQVIEGASQFIGRNRPLFLIEVWLEDKHRAPNPARPAFIAKMAALGYEAWTSRDLYEDILFVPTEKEASVRSKLEKSGLQKMVQS